MAANATVKSYRMVMYFHTDLTDYVLFKDWLVLEVNQMIIACFGTFLLAMLFEGFKILRAAIGQHYLKKADLSDGLTATNCTTRRAPSLSWKSAMFSSAHLAQTGCHLVQVTLGYALMLIVMTFSVWLFIAAALGVLAGYFAFGWFFPQYTARSASQDHCM